METFNDILDADRLTVFDGAMGSVLYSKGVYINRSYDELNLTNPDLVREIHAEYVRAGAEIIETNSFGATRHNLQQFGLEGNLRLINVAAARLAREAAADRALVAGAVGPLGLRIEPYGPTSFDEAKIYSKNRSPRCLTAELTCSYSKPSLTFRRCGQAIAPSARRAICPSSRR
jgi:homocysteine S-methyltransferase